MERDVNIIKKEFQLERIIFFSDAVFAIAITLLIIDIHIPLQPGMTNVGLMTALADKLTALMGFFISFFFIGGYWIIHHKMFGYVNNYDTRLIWLNLFFLLSIVLLPFTTSIFGMYGNLTAAFCLYIFNAVFTGMMNFFCWKHILNPKKKLTELPDNKYFRLAAYSRSLMMPVWFLFCGLMALIFNAYVGEMLMPVISILFVMLEKFLKKKAPISNVAHPDIMTT